MNKKEIRKLKILISSLLIVFGFALLGGIFTSNIPNSEWYDSIKPSITPPNYVFPIVWNILFLLIALSLYFAWKSAKNQLIQKRVGILFGINLILNASWSYLFFTMQNTLFAFYCIFLILASIISLMFYTYKISKKASWLLLPYLLWVSFATYLNYLMVVAN